MCRITADGSRDQIAPLNRGCERRGDIKHAPRLHRHVTSWSNCAPSPDELDALEISSREWIGVCSTRREPWHRQNITNRHASKQWQDARGLYEQACSLRWSSAIRKPAQARGGVGGCPQEVDVVIYRVAPLPSPRRSPPAALRSSASWLRVPVDFAQRSLGKDQGHA